ncbi:MAG: hypothetical protein RJB66_170 [Pseudomonadota bacterium]|jgi:apolipoprotein N-acyltransferase
MLSTKNLKDHLFFFCRQNKVAISASLLTGVMTGTSYIPFFPWAALFNYAPLWWFWLFRANSRKEAFWTGWLSQFVLNLIGFHWVYHTAHEFGNIPAPLALVVLFLFASLAHLYIPLVGLSIFFLRERFSARIPSHSLKLVWWLLFLSGSWALAEIYWPYIFQWHMGYTLFWAKLPSYHWADIIGFQGLSFVLLLFNAFFVWWHQSEKPSVVAHTLIGLSGALAFFALLNYSGHRHGAPWFDSNDQKQIPFLAIQANIGNTERISAERGIGYQDFILDRFISLSRKAIEQFPEGKVLVWPESAIPDYLDGQFKGRRRPQIIENFLRETQRFLITGGYSKEIRSQKPDDSYNALFMLGAQRALSPTPYRKKHLLAFGEYTPFGDWFPYLTEISPSGKGFSRGPGPQSLTLSDPFFNNLQIAPQICYEALYPEFSRIGTLAGAQILVNLTNDSWFGPNSEPFQHMSMTFARAIENRRPLLRVTNTGFTSAVEASGKILNLSPLYDEWFSLFKIPYQEKPVMTLYTRYGDLWPIVVLFFTLVGFVALFTQKQR